MRRENNPKLRSPWFLDEALGVARNISITERVKFAVRMEAFNVLNRVRWGRPNNAVTGANFGQIRAQGNTPRRMQLALRFTFRWSPARHCNFVPDAKLVGNVRARAL